MALLRKALMFAITSGIAKKAWDSYKQKKSAGAVRGKARLKEAGRNPKHADREQPQSW